MGYGESKHISEGILSIIASQSPGVSPHIHILRIGQISGPISGRGRMWNEHERFRSLLRSSKALGILPGDLGRFEVLDWIPVDVLAGIVGGVSA
jgi:thioester reductase-like protein